jgi:hypothetical protein
MERRTAVDADGWTATVRSTDWRTDSAFGAAGRGPALRDCARIGFGVHRRRPRPAFPVGPVTTPAWSVGLGRRVTRTGSVRSTDRRRDSAFGAAGRGPALRACARIGFGFHRRRPRPAFPVGLVATLAGSVGLGRRVTRTGTGTVRSTDRRTDSAFGATGRGLALRACARIGFGFHRRRPRPAFPVGLVATLAWNVGLGRRVTRTGTVGSPEPSNGFSVRRGGACAPGRGLALAFIGAGQGRRSRLGSWRRRPGAWALADA